MAPESQRQTDALSILEALECVATPVIINAAEIATRQNAKLNTIQKRISTISKRYNLNLQTTSVSGGNISSNTSSPSKPSNTPSKPKPARVTKPRTSKKTNHEPANGNKKAKAVQKMLEQNSDGDLSSEEGVKIEDGDGDDEESATEMILRTLKREDDAEMAEG